MPTPSFQAQMNGAAEDMDSWKAQQLGMTRPSSERELEAVQCRVPAETLHQNF